MECDMPKGRDKVTLKIPRPLYENIVKVIEGSGFGSVTEFVVFVLRDLVASKTLEKELALTREEIEMIKKRLKSLHYL